MNTGNLSRTTGLDKRTDGRNPLFRPTRVPPSVGPGWGCSVYMIQRNLRCVVCRNPVLLTLGCNKHVKARRLFGSYSLRTALQVLASSSFRCIYCGEKNRVESPRPDEM